MSFVSIEFVVFFSLFFVLYHSVCDLRTQNTLIVLGSYFFYGWWNWRFLPLLLGVSISNYLSALWLEAERSQSRRSLILSFSVVVSLLALGFFKYYNFAAGSFGRGLKAVGLGLDVPVLELALPLGISFMTFQGIAYVVDVYRGEHAAERNVIKFFGFKAFFPQMVAGPIERANNLLEQFGRERMLSTEMVRRASWMVLYGYMLKICVADSMAPIVNSLFVPDQPFGWSVIIATFAFGLQIYGDFCGYSLIAKGLALFLGFELVWNFRFPYWSTSVQEFWRRWHISLSRWLRDYLYIPLGGNRLGEMRTVSNLIATMMLGGLWHGASWNFVAWGLLHGIALAVSRYLPTPSARSPMYAKASGWALTMLVVYFGWFLFRATSYELLVGMLRALSNWEWAPVHGAALGAVLAVTVPVAALEWVQQRRGDDFIWSMPSWAAYLSLAGLATASLVLVQHYHTSFIYFQF